MFHIEGLTRTPLRHRYPIFNRNAKFSNLISVSEEGRVVAAIRLKKLLVMGVIGRGLVLAVPASVLFAQVQCHQD